MAAGIKSVLAVVVKVQHILRGGKEKGGRGSDGFGVGFGFGRRGVEWSEWVDWSGVKWIIRVNDPRITMVCNLGRGNKLAN